MSSDISSGSATAKAGNIRAATLYIPSDTTPGSLPEKTPRVRYQANQKKSREGDVLRTVLVRRVEPGVSVGLNIWIPCPPTVSAEIPTLYSSVGSASLVFLGALRHTVDFDRLCSLDFDATPSIAWCQARDKGALLP